MSALAAAIVRTRSELENLGVRWAVVGGLALAVRAEPRQTLDVDLAVAVSGDREAERFVRQLTERGFRYIEEGPVIEQTATERLAAVRLEPPTPDDLPVVVDFLFHSSGIENEVVEAAHELDVLPGLRLPVATRGHMIALKVLAGRVQDLADTENLLRFATAEDIALARGALDLIAQRGCDRGKDLQGALNQRIAAAFPPV